MDEAESLSHVMATYASFLALMYQPEKAKPMALPISLASIWQKIKLSGSPEEVSSPRIPYGPKSAASTRRKRHTADTANNVSLDRVL